MTKALLNPIGMAAPSGVQVVRIGVEGERSHALNLNDPVYGRVHLCRSGIKHGKVPALYVSTGKFISCYRCARLMKMNQSRYGSPLPPAK